MVDFNESHFIWKVEDGIRELKINEGTLLQTLKNIFNCNNEEIKEYLVALEKDVKVSLMAKKVENIVDLVKKREISIKVLNDYFYDNKDFLKELDSILEYFSLDEKENIKIVDKIIDFNSHPNISIIKQLMMLYVILVCNKDYFSRKLVLDPLNKENIKLKKVRNRYLKLDKDYLKRKDYITILNAQLELKLFLDKLQMNGTYEPPCNKSLNIYYYNRFTKIIDITLFTERIAKSIKYLNYFKNISKNDYSMRKDEINVLENLSGFSFVFFGVKGMLTREVVLKKALEFINLKEIKKEEIDFLNIVFEECRYSLEEELCNVNDIQLEEIHRSEKLLDLLLSEEPYDDIFGKFLTNEMVIDSFDEYYIKNSDSALEFLKKDIYYFLYKYSSEHERGNI